MKYISSLVVLAAILHAVADDNLQSQVWLQAAGAVPEFTVPTSLDGWNSQREATRATLWKLLGDLPPRPAAPKVTVLSREDAGDHAREKFEFNNGAGETVRGYCFIPKSATPLTKAPAILYCHWHGGQYDIGKEELLGTNATPVAAGPALAKLGYFVLGIDACGFGERNGQGPDGPGQTGAGGELTAAKFNLWMGRTLWGMILRDDLIALDYLCARPEVDAQRIGVTGISMGSTRAWWLMALDDRLRAGVHVACMTRYQELMARGQLKAHGIYYFVPGMLKHFDTEAVIACAAPRPILFMTGDKDGGSPVEGVRKLGRIVAKAYALHGAENQFENVVYPGVGHVYLPEMWERTLSWLDEKVKNAE